MPLVKYDEPGMMAAYNGLYIYIHIYMDVSKNRGGPPKSSILIGFGTIIITIHFGGFRPIFGNTHMYFFLRCFRDWDPYHI